jgi:hypothetical protein
MAGWCFGTFFPQFSPYIGNNHPNWLIFFRGVETTNQMGNGWTWWNVADSPAQLEILISDKLRIWEKLVKYWKVNCIELWIFRNNIRDEPAGAPTGRCWL